MRHVIGEWGKCKNQCCVDFILDGKQGCIEDMIALASKEDRSKIMIEDINCGDDDSFHEFVSINSVGHHHKISMKMQLRSYHDDDSDDYDYRSLGSYTGVWNDMLNTLTDERRGKSFKDEDLERLLGLFRNKTIKHIKCTAPHRSKPFSFEGRVCLWVRKDLVDMDPTLKKSAMKRRTKKTVWIRKSLA